MPYSILDAVKSGQWDYEPPSVDDRNFQSTRACPARTKNWRILAARLENGLPLWNSKDCRNYADVIGDTDD